MKKILTSAMKSGLVVSGLLMVTVVMAAVAVLPLAWVNKENPLPEALILIYVGVVVVDWIILKIVLAVVKSLPADWV